MGYMHINNLYKNPKFLTDYKEVYALEKIHGTSAHISFNQEEEKVDFFSGGANYSNFAKLFDKEKLLTISKILTSTKIHIPVINKFKYMIIYGEAYGGKIQKMRETYGNYLEFVAFDVKINDVWMDVPTACEICAVFGIEFVNYKLISTDLETVNAARNKESVQAIRNGVGKGKMREGIVLRPIEEANDFRGNRIIYKHKNDAFMETKTPRKVDMGRCKKIREAKAIAEEWVTEMRLTHVLDKFPELTIQITGKIIKAMTEDVKREAEGEIVWSRQVEVTIAKFTATMYKKRLQDKLQ